MGTRDDDKDTDDEATRAKVHFVQGMGLLFRAAGEAAEGLRKEIDKSDVGKQLDSAGKELYRAANNVVSRLGTEIFFGSKDKEKKDDEKKREEDPPRYAPGENPKVRRRKILGFALRRTTTSRNSNSILNCGPGQSPVFTHSRDPELARFAGSNSGVPPATA